MSKCWHHLYFWLNYPFKDLYIQKKNRSALLFCFFPCGDLSALEIWKKLWPLEEFIWGYCQTALLAVSVIPYTFILLSETISSMKTTELILMATISMSKKWCDILWCVWTVSSFPLFVNAKRQSSGIALICYRLNLL